MKYLVEFNNGFESDNNTLSNGFDSLSDAKDYAKANCDVYYNIIEGNFGFEDNLWQGSGTAILSNCADKSITWFYTTSADFCEVEKL